MRLYQTVKTGRGRKWGRGRINKKYNSEKIDTKITDTTPTILIISLHRNVPNIPTKKQKPTRINKIRLNYKL